MTKQQNKAGQPPASTHSSPLEIHRLSLGLPLVFAAERDSDNQNWNITWTNANDKPNKGATLSYDRIPLSRLPEMFDDESMLTLLVHAAEQIAIITEHPEAVLPESVSELEAFNLAVACMDYLSESDEFLHDLLDDPHPPEDTVFEEALQRIRDTPTENLAPADKVVFYSMLTHATGHNLDILLEYLNPELILERNVLVEELYSKLADDGLFPGNDDPLFSEDDGWAIETQLQLASDAFHSMIAQQPPDCAYSAMTLVTPLNTVTELVELQVKFDNQAEALLTEDGALEYDPETQQAYLVLGDEELAIHLLANMLSQRDESGAILWRCSDERENPIDNHTVLYGYRVHNGILQPLSREEFEEAYTTDHDTGEHLPPEDNTIFIDAPLVELLDEED